MDLLVPEFDTSAEMAGGADLTEAEVAQWLVEDGADVRAGQELVELTLDKANQTIEAPAGGRLRQVAREGDIVAPGDILGTID